MEIIRWLRDGNGVISVEASWLSPELKNHATDLGPTSSSLERITDLPRVTDGLYLTDGRWVRPGDHFSDGCRFLGSHVYALLYDIQSRNCLRKFAIGSISRQKIST